MIDEKVLKLKATSLEEIPILSSLMQDALVPVSGIDYDKKEQRFVILGFRFCWEKESSEQDLSYRVMTGISFSHITKVRYTGFHQKKHKPFLLNLLAIHEKDQTLNFVFSGGIDIQLTYEKFLVHMQDMKAPWVAGARPVHQEV